MSGWVGRIYFAYLPAWEWYRIQHLTSQNRDAILSIVNQLCISIIDLRGTFASHPDPPSLFPSRRYTPTMSTGTNWWDQKLCPD